MFTCFTRIRRVLYELLLEARSFDVSVRNAKIYENALQPVTHSRHLEAQYTGTTHRYVLLTLKEICSLAPTIKLSPLVLFTASLSCCT